jgi:4-amino-4-deoxy-L-arabinose transferase-like glycosyltransferase
VPPAEPLPPTPAPSRAAVPLIILAGAAIRLLLAAWVPLTTDEAYYTHWARHLQAGYLDHPPAVAWLMAAGLFLGGHHALAVRLPAALLQVVTAVLAADLARRRGGERAAVTAALLLQLAPVFSLGGVLMTPDAPLGLAWIGALWCADRAFRDHPRWLLLGGACLGLGVLSKLSAGLLGLALLAAFVATPPGRAILRTPWPWLGVLAAAAVASPMLLWNAARGWPSLAFQARHGLGGGGFSLARLGGSLGAQAAYLSPLLLVLAIPPAWRALRGPPADRPLAFSALPVAAFFTAAAAFTPGALPHWPAPGWLSASILLAAAGARWLRAALWFGAGSSALLVALVLLPLPLPGGPLDELRGWSQGAAAAREAAGGARLAAAHWMVLGHLSWAADADLAYVGERRSGPSLYAPDPATTGEPLLVVTVDGLGEDRTSLERRLGPLEPAGSAEARDGERLIRRYRFFRRLGAAAPPADPAPRLPAGP